MKNKKLRDMSMSNRIFYIINTIFWIVVMFIVLYPLYLVCIASVSNPDAVYRGEIIWKPVEFSLMGYKAIFEYKDLWTAYANSLFYTVTGVTLSIVVTLAGAYTLSRKKFPGKSILSMYLVITMFISGGLIPSFLLMKDIGLYNTRWILILTGCVSVWNLMVARTYIQTTIPEELYEAAVLDGASHIQYFSKVVFPLSKTIVAVLAVYYGVAKWNDYFTGMVYIRDRAYIPLQTVLKEILATLQVSLADLELAEDFENMYQAIRVANVAKYCIIVVSTAPVVVLYILLQKYFEKGVMIGSLKG